MKITLILLLTTAFSAFSMDVHSQNAKVSLDTNIMKVAQLISAIESQTNYLFVYSKKNVDLSRKVKINAKNKAVSEILDEVFSGTGITYVMEGKNIVLTKESNIAREEVKQQNTITVKGAITDMQGEAIIGANIIQQGTTNGTITDIDGNFSVSGKKGSTLVFSYIGMLTQEVVYKGTALRVVMKDDSKALEEVVVIGYQTVKKSDLTGAVAVVDTKEMKKSAAGTLVSQMQGLATGINVRSSGRAGEDASIEIRGVGSLSNNSPLWVIDGMITDPGVDFNPADAESIQILKDASAAAIYGSRAANGVIIVTTLSLIHI